MRVPVLFLAATATTFGLSTGRALRSSSPATYGTTEDDNYILKTGYLIGNGKLGVIPFGPPGAEKLNLNVDSLWSGGPFEVQNYTGGNPSSPVYSALPRIRERIFQNGTGDMPELLGTGDHYGSNRVLGNITISLDGVGSYSNYQRTLDLSDGVHRTTFTVSNGTGTGTGNNHGSTDFEASVFCSYPAQVCVYHLKSNDRLPDVTINVENLLVEESLLESSCDSERAAFWHFGVTQAGPPEGMKYAALVEVVDANLATAACSREGVLQVASEGKELTLIISAATSYDQKAGNAESGWSFKGEDPGPIVDASVSAASSRGYKGLLGRHVKDYKNLMGDFSLNLPDPTNSPSKDTAELIETYSYNSEISNGNPYLEALLFDYARHLLLSSSRPNSLPANLQGRWTESLSPAWSADYHANINLQMNYWVADQTGLAETQHALWNYIADTWVPRGTETARLLYNASGWVVHNEMNVFGFTAMKEDAGWANYPAAAAWMMLHVWDNFEYTQDKAWLEAQGYPLLKGVAEFWLSSLQEDRFYNDGSLVVNPCNSPETGPTTFGCTHYQQLIHQVFESVLAAQKVIQESDMQFTNTITSALTRLDKGLHISTWGGLKEWKLPESYGYDNKSTHRHLSHLVGWYPGSSIASSGHGYTNRTIQNAIRETLISRGMGNAADANAGWAKVWRAACWARLNDSAMAYDELRYAIDENFVGNGLSMYSGTSPPFQIDANFGFAGAVLAMLVVDLPVAGPVGSGSRSGSDADGNSTVERTVVLGPAIPSAWGNGSVKGLRLRGGGRVDFGWDAAGVVDWVNIRSRGKGTQKVRLVNVEGGLLAEL
ncbi:glycoside hydrolase family 95 protein [Aspergillus undulatus]|uniref:glycoside hydrolase family 95 protein n=1 Tax=Aspergillus undulatus TaxID=1810928 RepID=UPI003CCCE8DA